MMSYKPLSEILGDLDAQQRRELAALSRSIEAAALDRMRNERKKLSTVAVFFVERSWDVLAPQLKAFSLETEVGKSTEEIYAYLNSLHQEQPAYAWGWIRARMDARLMQLLEVCVPDLLRQHPEEAALYVDSLRRVGPYKFRETPLHHLKAGYHTALGVACKWYGSTFELMQESPASCPHAKVDFREELRLLASFSMTMLARTDRYLWDAAGASPLDAQWEEGTLKIAERAIREIALEASPDYGVRLGCPALRARRQEGEPAFPGVIAWVEQLFSRYLEPPVGF